MMFQSLSLTLLTVLSTAQAITNNSINLNKSFKSHSPTCNIFDEVHYCQQITIDIRMELVAISHKCACPKTYRCPADINDTQATSYCTFEENHGWNKCYMKCVPEDL